MSMSGGMMAAESLGLGANPEHADAFRMPAEPDPRAPHHVSEAEDADDDLEEADS